MGPTCGPVVLLLAIFGSQALAVGVKVHQEPMVAFVSGKPAMKHTVNGWEADAKIGYLTNKYAILRFCKNSFPHLDIRNIVEMNEAVVIKNWCIKGKECSAEKVIPYRCLMGEFQSEALLVPEGCRFDHVHNKKRCQSHDAWKKVAEQKCLAQGNVLFNYAILEPCETDLFEGVEYVCCPQRLQQQGQHKNKVHPTVSKDLAMHMRNKKKEHHKEKIAAKKAGKSHGFSAYDKYRHMGLKTKYNFEHQKFKQALEQVESDHHEKVTSVMKEWGNAHDRIQRLKSTDPKGAARMEKEVTERFKKTYQALEDEIKASKNQLFALHEQHIRANINDKKRKALDHLTRALDGKKPRVDAVVKYLERYLHAERKDREHTLKHYAHVRHHKLADLEKVREYTLKHLRQIDDRINQSLQLVNRINNKKIVAKINSRVREFMKKFYQEMDKKLAENLLKPLPKALPTVGNKEVVEQYKNKLKQDVLKEKETNSQVISNKIMESKKPKTAKKPAKKPAHKSHLVDVPKDLKQRGKYDDEVNEDEHLYVQPVHHNAAKDTISLDENELYVSKETSPHKLVSASSTTIGIVAGVLVACAVIVVAIVMVRKRSRRSPADNGFVEVSQAVSPEEKHVMSMQSSGYENPTYKFFEMQGQ